MYVINARNVHAALPMGIDLLFTQGERAESRNGPVLTYPGPVTTFYQHPSERVLFWPERDANPFLHLMESLWMLAGHNDVEFPASFAANMANYSDNGKTLWGAYGHRWRHWFERDNLTWVVGRLKADPTDRRVVLPMYDGARDPAQTDQGGKDIPCNTHIYFLVRDGRLDMTVCCRSNDIIWGAYGANAVHFSVLQEFVAACVGVKVGYYWQVSNNYHGYLTTLTPLKALADQAPDGVSQRFNPYAPLVGTASSEPLMQPFPLVSTDLKTWLMDLALFMEDPTAIGYRDPFFRRVAVPMYMAQRAWKRSKGSERYAVAIDTLATQCKAEDWRLAGIQWLHRRKDKANAQQAS